MTLIHASLPLEQWDHLCLNTAASDEWSDSSFGLNLEQTLWENSA